MLTQRQPSTDPRITVARRPNVTRIDFHIIAYELHGSGHFADVKTKVLFYIVNIVPV